MDTATRRERVHVIKCIHKTTRVLLVDDKGKNYCGKQTGLRYEPTRVCL